MEEVKLGDFYLRKEENSLTHERSTQTHNHQSLCNLWFMFTWCFSNVCLYFGHGLSKLTYFTLFKCVSTHPTVHNTVILWHKYALIPAGSEQIIKWLIKVLMIYYSFVTSLFETLESCSIAIDQNMRQNNDAVPLISASRCSSLVSLSQRMTIRHLDLIYSLY